MRGRRVRAFLAGLMDRGRREREMDEELRFWVEERAGEKIAAGLPPEEARRQARMELGGVEPTKERIREASASFVIETAWQDLRLALRGARRRPGFSLVVVVTLALAIGANAAVFSVFNGLLWRPPAGLSGVDDLLEISGDAGGERVDLSYPVLKHLRENASTIVDLAAYLPGQAVVDGGGGPEVVGSLQVTGNYFDVLGVRPALGGFFPPDGSFHPQVAEGVVVSHRLWRRALGGDPAIVAKSIRVNGGPLPVLGVAERGFTGHRGGVPRDLFLVLGSRAPGRIDPSALDDAGRNDLAAIARRAPGVAPPAVQAEISALAAPLLPARSQPLALQVEPLRDRMASQRGTVLGFFAVMLGIVGLLLAVACVNVTNMYLSRATEREREIALRLALGAGRVRLVRQLLSESLVLFALAGGLGLLLATWLVRLLPALLPPGAREVELSLGPDLRVLLFTALVTLVTGALAGLAPARRATRPDLIPAIQGRGGAPGSTRLRRLLVGGQMAAALMLLVCAGLFLRAFAAANALDLGFEPERVVTARFDLSLAGYPPTRARAFYEDLLHEVAGLPGVRWAAVAHKLPLASRSSLEAIEAEGVEPSGREGLSSDFLVIGGDYFQVMGIPLLAGRSFRPADDADAPLVAVINETMARRLWPDADPIGRRFRAGSPGGPRVHEVIGVAADARYHELREDTPMFLYLPLAQQLGQNRDTMRLLARHDRGLAPGAAMLRDLVRRVDPAVPILSTSSLEEELGGFLLPQRIGAWISGVVGLLGLVLGAVGVYGVTSYTVGGRRNEIGVRIALGARPSQVRRMVIGQGMWAPLFGMAAGVLAALGATRLLRGLLLDVSPVDPPTFLGVAALLGAVALAANWVPARRAARTDPARTLRVS